MGDMPPPPEFGASLSTYVVYSLDAFATNSFTAAAGTTSTDITYAVSDVENATAVLTLNGTQVGSASTGFNGTLNGLIVGENIVTVTVTSSLAENPGIYTFTLTVPSSGDANTDPYVSTFAGVRYKLPSIDAPIRYFQTMEDGKLLTINAQLKTCSSADLDVSNIRSLLALKNKMTAKQYSVIAQKLMTPETLSFFERIHVQHGDESLVMNLWNSKFEVLKNNLSVKAQVVERPDLITKTGIYTGYKASTLKFTFGTTKLFLSVYNSPMIRNGLSIETCAKNCNGVIVNALKQADMVLPSLDSVMPVATKDSAKRHVHTETFVDHDGLRTRNIVTYR